MESLRHFTHEHLLTLIHLQHNKYSVNSDDGEKDKDDIDFVVEDRLNLTHLQKNKNNVNSDDEEEKEDTDDEYNVNSADDDDFVVKDQHIGQCNMCKEEIYSFHLCYYKCDDCDYLLHKFCAELPTTEKNHPLHPGHDLTLSQGCQFHDSNHISYFTKYSKWRCFICFRGHIMLYSYHCSICKLDMDIVCATTSQQKMDHPSHPHPLQRINKPILSRCDACSENHKGTFYQCTTCLLMIHLNCALLPAKLQIQRFTNNILFSHSHLLTLAYSFPYHEQKSKFFPLCKVCGLDFINFGPTWLYKCDKCRYYVHVYCATSKKQQSLYAGLRKMTKNFIDADHRNLIKLPFPDESCNLIKHHFINDGESCIQTSNTILLNRTAGHPHRRLIRFDTHSSLREKSISLHDPMKRSHLLCDGCVKPVTTLPFYRCFQSCDFVLHEWCVRLTVRIQNHPFHPQHRLILKTNRAFANVFYCGICALPSNGFMYECLQCNFIVDINCALIPEKITHEAHPNHLLSRIDASANLGNISCKACMYTFNNRMGFYCRSCNFYLHIACALLLPSQIKHKFNKHPFTLRYEPVENHISQYFCEICEEEFDPKYWFYHCTTSAESMHTACVPIKEECEQAIYHKFMKGVYDFINVKFGGTYEIQRHPHHVSLIQGTTYHGCCEICSETLKSKMIFKCLTCKFAIDFMCATKIENTLPKRIWN